MYKQPQNLLMWKYIILNIPHHISQFISSKNFSFSKEKPSFFLHLISLYKAKIIIHKYKEKAVDAVIPFYIIQFLVIYASY